jgi:hypothetical protein
MRVECENCKKNIFNKIAFEITTGKVEIGNDFVGFVNGSDSIKGIKEEGLFCSLKCIAEWINKQKIKNR